MQISKKDKILFPKSNITKQDMVNYYDSIANHMLPFLKDRPLTMQRFPEGISKNGFFQKNASDYFPNWIKTVEVKKANGWLHQVICNTKETLLFLVNQYVVTFHITLSKLEEIHYPDKLIFDLDPPEGNFSLVIKAAKILRIFLEEELELKTYVMTTGSKGLHVVVPLKCEEDFDEVHEFAKCISKYIAEKYPAEMTNAIRKNQRRGRLYIDYLRNSYMQTSVSPFSLRALENAPLATLLKWSELDTTDLNAQTYTIRNIFKRLEQVENPWNDFEENARSILKAKKNLEELVDGNLTKLIY